MLFEVSEREFMSGGILTLSHICRAVPEVQSASEPSLEGQVSFTISLRRFVHLRSWALVSLLTSTFCPLLHTSAGLSKC